MVKDPYKEIRRFIPPSDFKFGKDKYVKNKKEEEQVIQEGLDEYYYQGDETSE